VGIASMAETGLLVDQRTGKPRTPLLPWFDRVANPQADYLAVHADHQARFLKSGIRPTYKCSLAKLLWLKERNPALLDGAVWLSAADYVAYRLTGVLATDASLAGRTYAFDLMAMDWDAPWLQELGLEAGLFPPVYPAGSVIGAVAAHRRSCLEALDGAPLTIAGHDHICAAFGAAMLASGLDSGLVFDSIGTAESLVGAFRARPLSQSEYDSGFSHGRHVAPGFMYWAGGLPASGGSIEWLRSLLGDPALGYQELERLLAERSLEPTRILYFPYLGGSASPHTDMQVRGAFIGLDASHGRADLCQAVLEGVAYEMEYLLRAAAEITHNPIERLVAAGGGTRIQRWMQIRADVSGCEILVLPQAEMVTFGAALLGGLGAGVYRSLAEAADQVSVPIQPRRYMPNPGRHEIYRYLYENAFLPLQAPLRALKLETGAKNG
jgi:xylulokinase